MKITVSSWVALCLACGAAKAAQCPQFSAGFHAPGADGPVGAFLTHDFGNGRELYVGGSFDGIGPDRDLNGVARAVVGGFEPLGGGLTGTVSDFVAFDSGSGDELFAAGTLWGIGHIARWDGSSWQSLDGGLNQPATELEVHDDGSGPQLYAIGTFSTAGGATMQRIARWNGSSWSTVGPAAHWWQISAIASFDAGSGPELYVAGWKEPASNTIHRIAKWNGTSWVTVTTSFVGGTVQDLLVLDDGASSSLIAGGTFGWIAGIPASKVARFDGIDWWPMGSGLPAQATAFGIHDDGSGPQLVAAAVSTAHRWNGSQWQTLGSAANSTITDIGSRPGVAGDELWIGGAFTTSGTSVVPRIAKYENASWQPVVADGNGIEGGNQVNALASYDFGAGELLYVAGNFLTAGPTVVNSIAGFDGSTWQALASGITGPVHALAGFDDGSGPALYATGGFLDASGVPVASIARWNGASWSAVGGGVSGTGQALAVFDDGSGPALYVGGYLSAAGGVPVNHIARWDGASWSALGSGLDERVNALAVFDDGGGPALYVFGEFTQAGGAPANQAAKWDGSAWSEVGGGLDDDYPSGRCALVHDDGSGPALFVGGSFSSAGATSAANIARWNGVAWQALGSGLGGRANALCTFDDGTGSALYVCGSFSAAGGSVARHIAKWDGSSWSGLGVGIEGSSEEARALAVFEDADAPRGALYIGGVFASAGGSASSSLARWSDPCACSGSSYCTSGTTSHGCSATITGTGRASASASSGFVLTVSNVEGAKSGHLFYGLSGAHAAPWGQSSHFLCVKAPSQRTGSQAAGGTDGACDGQLVLDWNQYVATHPSSLGVPFAAGADVWAQAYFRDPPGPKTTALSNALHFQVCP